MEYDNPNHGHAGDLKGQGHQVTVGGYSSHSFSMQSALAGAGAYYGGPTRGRTACSYLVFIAL